MLVSQYTAFLGGRLQETAIDLYAQDDDGSVWYLGEDVYDYSRSGMIRTTEGTWHAGTEGPLAMIMASDPQVGDVNRPENIPGAVFEEVEITATEVTVDGPLGPVEGIVGTETHQDGALSDKVFAPGYGEFRSTDGGDVEALALAVPTDAASGPLPTELATIARAADALWNASLRTASDRRGAARRLEAATTDWDVFRAGEVPRRLVRPMHAALVALRGAISSSDTARMRWASTDLACAANDLSLRYRSAASVNRRRFQFWARRAVLDAVAGSVGGLRSDQVTLEWIRDRIAHTFDPVSLTRLDARVGALGAAIVDRDLAAARMLARRLAS